MHSYRLTSVPLWVALFVTGAALCACGDLTSATGHFGNLTYGLYTDYEVGGSLGSVSLITGVPQHIEVSLSIFADDELEDGYGISHEVWPDDGVNISQDFDLLGVADFSITAWRPGSYTITSSQYGRMIDMIDLRFATPAKVKILSDVRGPDEDYGTQYSGYRIDIREGSEVCFWVLLTDGMGRAVVGQYDMAVTASPAYSVVTGGGFGSTLGPVNYQRAARSLFFVEPGLVTITVAGENGGFRASQRYQVVTAEGR